MKLTRKQRSALLEWAAEGLRLKEINERAAKFDPPFQVDYLQIRYARKRAKTKFEELRKELEADALNEGLARRAVRIRRLIELAERLEEDFFEGDRLWVKEPKLLGAEIVDVEKFNAAEVKEYRGLLDDIARELGDRKTKIEHSGKIDVTKLTDEELRRIIEAEGESGT